MRPVVLAQGQFESLYVCFPLTWVSLCKWEECFLYLVVCDLLPIQVSGILRRVLVGMYYFSP